MVAFQSSAIVAKFRTETAHLFPYFFALFPLILPLCRYRLNLPTLSISILELYVIFVIFGGVIVLHQLQYSILQLWSKKKLLLILSSIFIAAGAIGIFFSADPKFSLGVFRVYFVEHFIVAVIGWCLYDAGFFEKKHIRFGFVSGAILLVLVGTHALLQHADLLPSPKPWIDEVPRRASSLFPHPNSLGLLIAPFTTFYAVFLLCKTEHASQDRKTIFLSAAASISGLVAVLLSRSDGALVGLMVGIFAYLFFSRHARRLLIIVVFTVCLFIAVPDTRSYMTRAFTEGSLGSRNVLWENTSRLLADRPIQGAGLGSFQKVYKRYRTSPNQELLVYPHMIVLNFWVELGVVGLSAGAAIVYLSLKNAWQRIHRQKHAVFIALFCVWITVLVHGLIDVPFFNNDLSFLWWLLVWG